MVGVSADMATKGSNPLLCGKRVIIQPLYDCDLELVLEYYLRNQEHFAPTASLQPKDFYTNAFWRERIQRARAEWKEDTAYRFVLNISDTEQVIGTINLTQVFRGAFQACYLGFGIDREYEGGGLMREGLELVCDYAFGILHLHRIMANHLIDNEKSARLLRRLGFQREGVAKDYLFVAGRWRDHVLNALVCTNGGDVMLSLIHI